MTRVLRLLARYPWWVFGVLSALTVAAALACFNPLTLKPRFRIDASAAALMPTHSPNRALLALVKRRFGDNNPVIVAVRFKPRVFTAENLRRVTEVDAALRRLRGVQAVFSLADASNPHASGNSIDVGSFTKQAAADPQRIPELERQLQHNPLYRNTLISVDGRDAAFSVLLDNPDATQFRTSHMQARIRAAVNKVVPDARVWVTGHIVIRAATQRALFHTFIYIVPTVFAAVLILLLLSFGSLRVALLSLLTIFAALIWTLAASRFLGISLNLVTTIVPPLVVTIGLSYTIHLLSAWFQSPLHVPEAGRVERREWVMRRIGVGLALSAATTVVGFLSLLLNPLNAVRDFAVLAAVGVAITALLTLILLPTLLTAAHRLRERSLFSQTRFAAWAQRLANFDRKRRRYIVLVAVLLVPVALWFAVQIRTGTDFVGSFDRNATVRQDFDAINTAFDGANVIQVYVKGDKSGALAQPAAARAVDALEGWLRKQPEVGAVWSYVDLLKRFNLALNGDNPQDNAVPDSAAVITQDLMFGGGSALSHMLDVGYRSGLVTVRINVDGSRRVGQFLKRLNARLQKLPPGLTAQATGATVLATHAVNAISSGHLASVGIATLAIWLLLSIMFTSVTAGLLATLPNLVPVLAYFGALGALGITLNPTTSLIASIVLGIAVNDTIHFLARFNSDARERGAEYGALETALAAVLRPITLATITLCLGFLAFTAGTLHSQAQFGALAAFTLAVAWLSDMTLTPALSSRLHIVTLWDLLRMNLGPNPQHTIPLFKGLNRWQARQFALTARMETVSPGSLIIREGEQSGDIFVVIDGETQAWVERQGERKLLSTMGRGAVMGETGHFGQKRTANVVATSATRLLRFDDKDLERLRRRYPWVAATVLRNLNLIQAERIAHMTEMLADQMESGLWSGIHPLLNIWRKH